MPDNISKAATEQLQRSEAIIGANGAAKNAWLSLVLSALSGAMMTLAYAPFEFFPLALLSPALLAIFCIRAPQHIIKLHFAYGLGLMLGAGSWIFTSMHVFAQAHIVLSLLLTAVFILAMSQFFTLQGWLIKRFYSHHHALSLCLLFPAAWVLQEWFRGWFLTGYSWLFIGHAFIDTPLAQLASLGGVYFVTFAALTISMALAYSWLNKRWMPPFLVIAYWLLTTLIATHIEWTQPNGKVKTVSIVQGNIAQATKWDDEQLQPTIDLYEKLTEEVIDSDIIIWPETAIPDLFSNHLDSLINPLAERAKDNQQTYIIGGFYNNQGSYENSALAISPTGKTVYSKHHLVPFSEYIPMLEYLRWLEKWIQLPYDSVGKGSGAMTLDMLGTKAKMSICYEDAFGRENIKQLADSDWLINLSNDGWFTGSLEPYQHAQLARFRAIEAGRYFIRSTNIGISSIIDPYGQKIVAAPMYTTQTLSARVFGFSGRTPYMLWGDWAIVLFAALCLMALVALKKRATDETQSN